jgi:hypothetical protein
LISLLNIALEYLIEGSIQKRPDVNKRAEIKGATYLGYILYTAKDRTIDVNN